MKRMNADFDADDDVFPVQMPQGRFLKFSTIALEAAANQIEMDGRFPVNFSSEEARSLIGNLSQVAMASVGYEIHPRRVQPGKRAYAARQTREERGLRLV